MYRSYWLGACVRVCVGGHGFALGALAWVLRLNNFSSSANFRPQLILMPFIDFNPSTVWVKIPMSFRK